MQRKGFKKSK